MTYVFDTSSFLVLKNYYPSRFPTVWKGIEGLVKAQSLISVREVLKELESYVEQDIVLDWANSKEEIFLIPTSAELHFVSQIFAVPHFQAIIGQRNILKGTPVADPFAIALAKVRGACAVTEETMRPNAAKIPNVCEHFGSEYTNLEGFMNKEGWTF